MPELDISSFKDKDSKKPQYRELYEKHDFLQAYSQHTDMRIFQDGPELAIGAKADGKQDWDIHGLEQLNFLIGRGLSPDSKLLDMGCGTGRLAVKAIPYLSSGNYWGVDISKEAISYALKNALNVDSDGCEWAFTHMEDGLTESWPFADINIIWAHSVFTHLPPEVIQKIFHQLKTAKFNDFYFTYKRAARPQRSGLKQFQYNPGWFIQLAEANDMQAELIDHDWPAGQKTMRVWK